MSGKHFLWRYILELQHPRYVEKFQTFFGLERLSAEGKKDVAKSPKQTTTTTTTTTPRLTPHRINNYFWYYLFFLGTKLGYEIFYALLYSFTFWNVDSLVCRRSIFVWSVCMYLGQALKDILRLPRPHPDHVLVLEPEYSLEYGMPSTHAILALSMPVTLFHSMGGRYQFSIAIFVTMALLWIALICGSRLYLGMHSLLDIFGGLSLTVLILAVVLPCLDSIDHFVTTSLYSPVVVLIIVTTLSLLYPHHNARSPTRGDTCVIIGSSAGFLLVAELSTRLGASHCRPSSSGAAKLNHGLQRSYCFVTSNPFWLCGYRWHQKCLQKVVHGHGAKNHRPRSKPAAGEAQSDRRNSRQIVHLHLLRPGNHFLRSASLSPAEYSPRGDVHRSILKICAIPLIDLN